MYQSNTGLKSFRKNRTNPFKKGPETIEKKPPVLQVSINQHYLLKVFNLSRTGIKILLYFITNQLENSGIIYFDLKECKLFTGFNDKRSIYNGLIELLGEAIIARTDNENTYYLNLDIINSDSKK